MAAKKWNLASYPDIHRLEDKVEDKMKSKVWDLIVRQMEYIGEKCIAIARDKNRANTWGDVTGNLRSSIGYVVQVNGKPVRKGPEMIFQGQDGARGSQGPAEARRLMKSLQGIHASGVELIVVAGMEYAEYVEVIHHKDVLSSAQQEGEKTAKLILERLFEKVKGKRQ